MLGSIKYNLTNLLNFKGREARQTFWFYVLFLFILQYAAGLLISMPMMSGMMKGAFSAAQQGATEAELQARLMAQMAGYMRTAMTLNAVVAVIAGLLLLTAFIRRLHDSNRPGWIALIPLVLSLAAQALIWSKMGEIIVAMNRVSGSDPTAILSMQSKVLGASLMSWGAILIVIVFGVWPSTPGPNRYGDAPVRH
ncbi:uncharacterized membrane protein YhaH (DUF805 family) [Novosphingobium sp. PhB165]|uniref:DUF805 domain-containing protein n=1 Tax=Novosphingobium sp. PhB165 TaxID=2485105 RepID=UPI0010488D89|nr:DUF805 domain-containing protein [Novosphingobium sp. PhB165]TCM22072.1 uncharacterized membrane protein YhaH (DUF805 family) [Novosphingobium sp. PhB165]